MTPYPAVGQCFDVRFEDLRFEMVFDANGIDMTFTRIGRRGGRWPPQTVRYAAEPVAENVFLVHWQEDNGTTVVHVENFTNGVVHTNITLPDHTFHHLRGTMMRQRQEAGILASR